MKNEALEMRGHTGRDGVLHLSLATGVLDADVAVSVQVRPLEPSVDADANGWPIGFFERIAGSMPELKRSAQGQFEERLPYE